MRQKIYIGVMGVTGAGKSTFIKTASENDTVAVGESFKSFWELTLKVRETKGTTDVLSYRFQHDDFEIVLIDTPGFNDTTRGETEVLKEIASWLDITYRNPPKIKLSGIIYMQALDDRRIYGSTLRNLRMFRDLCGEEPLKNVIFTTTGWGLSRKSDTLAKSIEKESQLCVDPLFWEPMIRRGAQTARFEDTRKSALDIIMRLVPRDPIVLQIQHELVDDNKDLIDTKAGNTVNEEVKRLEAKYKAEIASIKQEMAAALAEHDLEMQSALSEHTHKLERLRDDARRAQDMLQYQRRNADRRYEDELQQLRNAFELAADEERKRVEAEKAAQKYEDELQFEGIVQRMRENLDRVRREEREVLEREIRRIEMAKKEEGAGGGGANGSVDGDEDGKEGKDGKDKDKEKKKGKGKKLLLTVLPIVGNLALTTVGFVLGVGPISVL